MSVDLVSLAFTEELDEWREIFNEAKPELLHITKMLKGKKVIPKEQNIFRAFKYSAPEDVKVVILGTEPYNTVIKGEPFATGLAFATPAEFKIQSSLANMYEELERNYGYFKAPNHGDLTSWAEEGVLLLNIALTAEEKNQQSHAGIWKGWINKIIEGIEEANPNVIFVFWGAKCIMYEKMLSRRTKMLFASHPSSLSYKKCCGDHEPFYKSFHFQKIDKELEKKRISPIDWFLD